MLADAGAGAVSEPERNSLPPHLADIANLIGSAYSELPSDLSARTKHYPRVWGYGRDRSARQARQQR
jgi:hypothetical protein